MHNLTPKRGKGRPRKNPIIEKRAEIGRPKKIRKILTCSHCGKNYTRFAYKEESSTVCSNECRYAKFNIAKEKNRKKRIEKKVTIKKVCENKLCKKEFTVDSVGLKRRWCCHKCYLYSITSEYRQKIHEKEMLKIKKEELIKINKIFTL